MDIIIKHKDLLNENYFVAFESGHFSRMYRYVPINFTVVLVFYQQFYVILQHTICYSVYNEYVNIF